MLNRIFSLRNKLLVDIYNWQAFLSMLQINLWLERLLMYMMYLNIIIKSSSAFHNYYYQTNISVIIRRQTLDNEDDKKGVKMNYCIKNFKFVNNLSSN